MDSAFKTLVAGLLAANLLFALFIYDELKALKAAQEGQATLTDIHQVVNAEAAYGRCLQVLFADPDPSPSFTWESCELQRGHLLTGTPHFVHTSGGEQ